MPGRECERSFAGGEGRDPNGKPNTPPPLASDMGLGSTAKKLQDLADAAEKLFRQLHDLRERVSGLEETLQTTSEQVGELDREQRRQRALLEAVAEEQGVDVDVVIAEVDDVASDEESAAASADGTADDGPTDGSSGGESTDGSSSGESADATTQEDPAGTPDADGGAPTGS
jgi:hypothetical protein